MSINLNKWLIVIPARLHSTRLVEKPLVDLCGTPLIVRVCERLSPLEDLGAKIIVATDSEKILQVLTSHNIQGLMTSTQHQSGTDRVYEVSQQLTSEYILNVQGDEPFVNVEDLKSLMQQMQETKEDAMATLVHKNTDKVAFNNPNCVKAVISKSSRAIYFSRSPIPFDRDEKSFDYFWQHIGVYAFSKVALKNFCAFEQSRLEKCEKLEQLRALENNIPILITKASKPAIGIDTQEDLDEARKYFTKNFKS